MVMSIIMAPPLPLILLLMIQGVYSADDVWSVNYSPSYTCALKDSLVIINCTYKYPPGHQIRKVFWTKINSEDPPDLSEDSEYSQRIQYLGDKQHDCSIRLTDVRHTDSHKYYFRFITNKGKWIGKPGVSLDITDLQVESAETVTEGHSVTLTCKSRCSLTDRATFIWIKNTQSLRERTDRKNQLILQSVRREDAGSYSCAVQGHSLTSPAVYLNVMYPPKETLVVVSPSVKIVEGDSVTLTCISEANPPVQIYTWFKENETSAVGSGQSFRAVESGWFYCEAQNEVGSQRSAAVSVTVTGNMMIFYTIIGLLIFGAAVGIMVLVIWWMKKRNKSESQIVHHSPPHNVYKTRDAEMCDEVYENLRTADDSCDDLPDYENITLNRNML